MFGPFTIYNFSALLGALERFIEFKKSKSLCFLEGIER